MKKIEGLGTERIINNAFEDRDDVVLWDVLPVKDGELLELVFESKNSDWRQGIWLMCNNGISIMDEVSSDVILWFDQPQRDVSFTCLTDNESLSIYNVWDRGQGTHSQSHSSGMLVEDLPNGRRYRCNDIGFKAEFDKLVFRIVKVTNP